MTDVAAGDKVDDVFGDVRGMVADALEILGDQDQLESGEHDRGIFHHVSKELAKELVAQAIHLIVALEHAAGEIDVSADESIQAVAHHTLSKLAHARKIHIRLYLGVTKNAHGRLRDIHGLIADPFEVAVNARNR